MTIKFTENEARLTQQALQRMKNDLLGQGDIRTWQELHAAQIKIDNAIALKALAKRNAAKASA